VQDGNQGYRPLELFVYSQANGSGTGYSLGKLLQASRYNYVLGDGSPYKVEIRYNYAYGDLAPPFQAGRVTGRTTQFVLNDGPTAVESFTQSFAYEQLGNLATLGYPQCTAGGCSGASGARSVGFTYTRLLTGVSGYTTGAGITYGPHREVNQVQHANGVVDAIAPDPSFLPRPSAITSTLAASTLWSTGAYSYDGAGNVSAIGPASFVYDPVSRLTSGTVYLEPVNPVTPRSQTYSFDAFGNLTWVGNVATPTAAGTNRLTGAVYDAAGNTIAWNGQNYTFDPFNQMIRFCAGTCLTAAGQTGEDWVYMYDADGERVWSHKNFQNPFRRTLRDLAGHVLRDNLSGDVSATEDYIYRDGQLLAAETPTGTQHLSLDHLGTPRLITNASGSQLAYHVYYPFGREATYINQDGERMKFTGHERDLGNPLSDQDDLDYMHARHYSPLTGRFLSVDSIGGSSKFPQSWGRYAFVRGNPLKLVDPNGKCAAPAGLTEGQVGICIESFIAAARIGRIGFGDGRGFARNDPGATFRTSLRMIIDPSSGAVVKEDLRAGKSQIGLGQPALGLPGSVTMNGAALPGGDGKTNFTMSFAGRNGFGAITPWIGNIGFTVNMSVDSSGKTQVDPATSTTKGFPSVEGYAYQVVNGELFIHVLFEVREQDPSKLNGPMNVPLAPPPN
jgi:RHS repeat-associated protein